MNYSGAWTAQTAAYAPAGEWAARPRYTPADFVTLLWRERYLMAGVFLVLFLLGLAAAFTLKTEYPAHSSILVKLGQEYVYEPSIGDAGRGAIPTTDQLVQSEVEILSSAELRRRVIVGLGYGRVFPDHARVFAEAGAVRKKAMLDQGVAAMGTALKVESAPDSTVVRLTYSDTNPDRAALVLNKLIDEYMDYRRLVLLDGSDPAVDQQLAAFQSRLQETDTAYQSFLASNNIDDFDAEKASLNSLQASLTDESFRVQARLQEIDGRLGELGRQLGRISPEISLYHDTNPAAADKLLQLRIDRQDLLSRYRADAQPVRDIDQRIAQMQAMQEQAPGEGGSRRIGVNPIYQTAQSEQVSLNSESASLKQRQTALASQLGQIAARRQKLTELEPQYLGYGRDRDLLQAEIRSLMQKKQENQAAQSIGLKSSDNIRVVERPTPPRAGKSLKKPVAALALMFAAFSAFCAGLLRVFLRKGFATSASAGRTLELPVLAAAALKRDV